MSDTTKKVTLLFQVLNNVQVILILSAKLQGIIKSQS